MGDIISTFTHGQYNFLYNIASPRRQLARVLHRLGALENQETQLTIYIFLSQLTGTDINQSDVPDWKMRNAVMTPTTPVSPSASAGSGAISPTFCTSRTEV